jgi:hypothetical protein
VRSCAGSHSQLTAACTEPAEVLLTNGEVDALTPPLSIFLIGNIEGLSTLWRDRRVDSGWTAAGTDGTDGADATIPGILVCAKDLSFSGLSKLADQFD